MKTIATINFKGGVGKTTITWALGHASVRQPRTTCLVFDLDAQMSLTQSIALNEDGNPFKDFSKWHERSERKKKTIFDALDEYTKPSAFNFGINYEFIYQIADRYHFIPSNQELYWTELELFDREKIKFFIQRLLEKIQNSKNVPDYDYILFDCPPSLCWQGIPAISGRLSSGAFCQRVQLPGGRLRVVRRPHWQVQPE